MDDSTNPYLSPASLPEEETFPLSLGKALARGFSAANATWLGTVVFVCILGPQQTLSFVTSGLVQNGALTPRQPGQPPSAALFVMMGAGCFTCVWALAALFATPWATGAILGQLRDRMITPEGTVGGFAGYGKLFFGRMLIVMLLFMVCAVVILIPVWIVSIALATTQMGPGQLDPQAMNQISRHPANLAVTAFAFLVMTAAAVVINLAESIVVVDNERPVAAIRRAVSFCGRRSGDVIKLYCIYLSTGVPMIAIQLASNVSDELAVKAAIGIVCSLILGYVGVLNLSLAISVYLARRSVAESAALPITGGQ